MIAYRPTRKTPPVSRDVTRTFRWLPKGATVAILVTAAPFGWSRDFDIFLIGITLYIPALLFAGVVLIVSAAINTRARRALLHTLGLLVILAPLVIAGANRAHDRVQFMIWYFGHFRSLDQYMREPGVIAQFDSWGFLWENDSYLVSDPTDSISERDGGLTWIKQQHPGCEGGGAERMMRGLYIVTTYDCPL